MNYVTWQATRVYVIPEHVISGGPFSGMTVVDLYARDRETFFRWIEARQHFASNQFNELRVTELLLNDLILLDDESYYITVNE